MKKLYSIISAVVLVASSAVAATPASSLAAKMQQASKAPAKTEVTTSAKALTPSTAKQLKAEFAATATKAEAAGIKTHARKIAVNAPEDGEWVSLGMGQYRDDLMAAAIEMVFNHPIEPRTWDVEIEQNGDWYRLQPYTAPGNPVAELLMNAFGVDPDEDYMYINAADPTKTYAEPFYPYPDSFGYGFLDAVEPYITGNDTGYGYGTLENGIISWEPSDESGTIVSWLMYDLYDGNLYYLPQTVGVAVALPGSKLPDYTLDFTAPIYTETGDITATLTPGFSLDKIAYVVLKGVYETSYENNDQIVAQNGDRVSNSPEVSLAIELTEGNGIYSIMMVGLDESENIMSKNTTYVVLHNHEGEKWVAAGTTEFTEGVYSADYNLTPQTYTVNIEQDENNPGHIRLVNAFTACPLYQEAEVLSNDEADNNLYIDMSNKEQVAALPSVTGIDLGNGNGILCSFTYMVLEGLTGQDYDDTVEELEFYDYFGKVDEDGLLTLPMYTLELSERGWQNGAFVDSYGEIAFQLPEEVLGVKDIIATDSAAPAVYYNLQGVRVDNPAKGGIYIRTQAGKASKVAL